MNPSTHQELSEPFGCKIVPLDNSSSEAYISWLLGELGASAPTEANGLVWALSHCTHGVTWGRYDSANAAWHWEHPVDTEISPLPCRNRLQELRLFGDHSEILIWQIRQELRGRLLTETTQPPPPYSPCDEERILLGDHVHQPSQNNFTHVLDRAGAEQILPIHISAKQLEQRQIKLKVRHYWQRDNKSGSVRIAVTRLVGFVTVGVKE